MHPNISIPLRVRKRGFTLTEIAIVLGIIGTILGAIWVAAAAAYTNVKTTKMVHDIMAIESGIRATYATRNTINAGYFNTSFVNMGIVPSDMVGTGTEANGQTAILDPWQKTVDIGSQIGWDKLPKLANAFEIIVGNPADTVTTAECQQVLMAVAGPAEAGSGLIGVAGDSFAAITDISTITDKTFVGCLHHFTLQYSLQ